MTTCLRRQLLETSTLPMTTLRFRLPHILLLSLALSLSTQAAEPPIAPGSATGQSQNQTQSQNPSSVPAAEILQVTVQIGDEAPIVLDAAALELLPHQTVKATEHGGEEAEWNGVPLYQILQHAGFSLGDSLRGPALGKYVLVTAADGYRAVFALPELDPRSTDDPVILATERNAAPLPAGQGPCRLVLPKEKRHFRWVRQVLRIEVKDAR